MAKIMFGVLDSNQAFAKRLSNFIIEKYEGKYSASYFSSGESVQRYLNSGLTLDVLLVNEGDFSSSLENIDIETVIILGGENNTDGEVSIIKKFQPAESIVSDAIGCLASRSDKKFNIKSGDKRTKVVSFYSPIGGSGNTCLAIGSAIYQSEKGKRVLYLNFEDVESMSLFLEKDSSNSMSELLYYLKQGNKNLKLKMEAIRKKGSQWKFDYISPFGSSIDKMELSFEDVEKMLEELKNIEEYDYIFIDMDKRIDETAVVFFRESDRIIVTVSEDAMSMKKLENVSTDLSRIDDRFKFTFDDKVALILNKRYRSEASDYSMRIDDSLIEVSGVIPHFEKLFRKNGDKLTFKSDFIDKMNVIKMD